MEKILFIVPPHISFDDFISPSFNVKTIQKKGRIFGSSFTDMPLGVLAMSSYVKKNANVETRLLDSNIDINKREEFPFRSFAEYFNTILLSQQWIEYAPTIVAISTLFTTSYRSMLDIGACCRTIFPGAIIIAGGGVPTNLYRDIFQESTCFDALCFGEGEKPLLGLVKAEAKLTYLEETPSWITRKKAENGQSYLHDLIEDLDEIPFYDYGICEIDDYGLNPAISAYASIEDKQRSFHVMTSRGCTQHCCFCSSHTVHGRSMRYYSVDRVREDFTLLKNCYGAKTIIFQDDHFVADKQRAFDIIDIVKELHITAVFQNGLALYALDKKMLEALQSAGLHQIVLAAESGSDRVLKEIMHKPLTTSIIKRVADDCRKLGMYTNVNILLGLPGETKQDMEDTKTFLKTIHANWFIILCATPLVGSEMLDICLKKNYLKGSYLDCDYKKTVVETEDFTAEYIKEKAYLLNLELNFVENCDFRLGDYETALKGFENAIRAKNDHALAYYYASKCHEKIGNAEKAREYMIAAKQAAERPFWRNYIDLFHIPL
jgi:anaerobic magnesium-protoporphyrin IX monomethyl ester cyclase